MTKYDDDDPAAETLLGHLVECILKYADNPGACAKHVTTQIRELIGVRIVALVSNMDEKGICLVGICPPRRKADWCEPEIQRLISLGSGLVEPRLIHPGTDPLGMLLSSIGIGASFIIPLLIGAERVGMLVLLDLLDLKGASKILDALTRISTILALILKNSYVYEHLEKTVATRTEQLVRSERLFRALFEQASAGIFFLDTRGKIIAVNESFARLHGYTVAEMQQIGLEGLDAEGIAHFPERARRIMSGEHLTFEVKHLHRDGHILSLDVAANLISTSNEQLIIAIHHDITERKRAEAEKAELEAQKLQIQKAESLNRMAGAIAHHFNNQLQAVMGNLEMVLDDMPEGADSSEALNEAMKAAGKASEVSRLLLTYIGQTPGRLAPLDLSGICRQSLSQLQAGIPNTIIVKADLPPSGPVVLGNTFNIEQILACLLTNARESTGEKPGIIALSIKTVSQMDIPASKRYPIGWQPQPGAYACLEVRDTGCGIERRNIDKIFDPFFTTRFSGRGLGLPVVLGIVSALGGGITVLSNPGQGSVFQVFLPVSADESLMQRAKAKEVPEINQSCTVLLVEDELQVRNMVKKMLMRLGHTVIEANNGNEAVQKFLQHHDQICCVLSDLTMPGMDGWDTLTALRKISPDIPVILSSGYDEAKVMTGDHPESPQAFLGKPYQLKMLKDTINRILTTKQSHENNSEQIGREQNDPVDVPIKTPPSQNSVR